MAYVGSFDSAARPRRPDYFSDGQQLLVAAADGSYVEILPSQENGIPLLYSSYVQFSHVILAVSGQNKTQGIVSISPDGKTTRQIVVRAQSGAQLLTRPLTWPMQAHKIARIAFSMVQPGNGQMFQIYVGDLNESEWKPLVSNPQGILVSVWEDRPCWSPEDSHIAFASTAGGKNAQI